MEIPNVRANQIISDDFILIFKFDKITLIYNYEIQQLFLFRFQVDICNKKIEKINTSISTFHYRLHNSTAHLSNVLKLSRSFDTQ
jgi:hypothetical protein